VDWRREDTGYAAAAVGAVGFVVYLLAANFGLVPSPIAGLGGAQAAEAAIQIPPDVRVGSVGNDLPPVAPATAQPMAEPVTPSPIARDELRPTLAFSTEDGASFGVTVPATIEGRAADASSGVDKVFVTFKSQGQEWKVPAKVTCTDASRRNCTWTAEVPGVLADYDVSAKGTDRAGNEGSAKDIGVTVVNTGGVVKQVGETVARAPTAVTDAVGTLLSFLLGGP
jgi:hypothetical protein